MKPTLDIPLNEKKLEKIADEIRINIIEMLKTAGSGHPASALGFANIFTCLYFYILKHDPKKPNWRQRDYLLMSNGHVCPVWYATLAQVGYFSKKELLTLRQLNSRLQGHAHLNSLPGIENTSGSLGQGLSQACGLALALKMDKRDNHVYCIISDGEMQEGQTWEALMLATKYKLDNLTILIDRNYIQIEGDTQDIMPMAPFKAKVKSFIPSVFEADGENFKQIIETLKTAKEVKNKPSAVIFYTKPGFQVDFMLEDYHWHGMAPDKKQAKEAIKDIKKNIS